MAATSAAGAPRARSPGETARPVPRVLQPLATRMADQHTHELFQRDADYVSRWLPRLALYTRYFSPEVRGLDHLPADGPVLVVGNHSGLFYLADACIVTQAIIARRGADKPAYSLTYDLLFVVPWYGTFLRRIGAIPAGEDEADAALASRALVLVFPGGDWEACRPWTHRNRIEFAGRQGFVRLALRHGVPVVPVVSHGAHHAVVVVSRGEAVARILSLGGMHIHVFPFALAPPLGISPVLSPALPAKITVEFQPALDWSGHGRKAARDDDIVRACYDEITATMQRALDRLNREHPHPLVSGAASLARGAASAPFRRWTRS